MPFSLTRYFAAGDTLDFLVGVLTPGEYCAFYADSTGLAVTITPAYNVCPLYDATRVAQSGATYPVKIQLCDFNGGNLSSSTLTLHAIGVTQTSTSISGPTLDSGNANPDSDFRFDPTLGGTGGYIFNLSTKGLSTGHIASTLRCRGSDHRSTEHHSR